MNSHYNLLLCYLSARCTFARSALTISVAKRAGNLRFTYTTIYTKVNGGAFTAATGGRKNSRNDVFFYLPLQQFCHTCTQAAQSRALVAGRACT